MHLESTSPIKTKRWMDNLSRAPTVNRQEESDTAVDRGAVMSEFTTHLPFPSCAWIELTQRIQAQGRNGSVIKLCLGYSS